MTTHGRFIHYYAQSNNLKNYIFPIVNYSHLECEEKIHDFWFVTLMTKMTQSRSILVPAEHYI